MSVAGPMRLRAPQPGDAAAVLAVLVARDLADLGRPDYTLEDLHDEWARAGFDLAADARVAETKAGVIVGYAAVAAPGALAVVSPAAEGQGIGARLLAWTQQRERERGREHHRQWIPSTNGRARALLEAAGYRHARSYARLTRSLADLPGPARPPAGVRLRALDVERDGAAVHRLNEAAFAANPDYEPESFAAFGDEHLAAHDLDPALSRVAEQAEQAVGFLLARRWASEGIGFVDLLGVAPAARGHGVGRALLTDAFAAFAAAGLRAAELGVAYDNPRARRLYERSGMVERSRADVYERPVT